MTQVSGGLWIFLAGGFEKDTHPGRIAEPLENKAQNETCINLPNIYVSEGVFVNKAPENNHVWGGPKFFWGGCEQETTPTGPQKHLKTRPNMCNNLAHLCPRSTFQRGLFVHKANDRVLGGGGVKGAQFEGSHVSTCWNPEMLFSLRYGVTFRGLRFGHHVS